VSANPLYEIGRRFATRLCVGCLHLSRKIQIIGDFMKKKTLLFLAYTPIVLAVIYISLYFIAPVKNNISLSIFANQINTNHLPEQTMIITKEARCGKLNGNGNGMDFFACALIESNLSLNELKQFYEGISFKTARWNKEHSVEVDVIPAKYELETDYYERETIYFDKLKDMTNYLGYYILILYDGGYPADFDMRGN